MHNGNSLAPITVNGWVLHSLMDDSDPCYHADALNHQTPAQERSKRLDTAAQLAKTVKHARRS